MPWEQLSKTPPRILILLYEQCIRDDARISASTVQDLQVAIASSLGPSEAAETYKRSLTALADGHGYTEDKPQSKRAPPNAIAI